MEQLKSLIIGMLKEVPSQKEMAATAESISDTTGIPYVCSLPFIVRNMNLLALPDPDNEQRRQIHNVKSAYKSLLQEAADLFQKFSCRPVLFHEEKLLVRTIFGIYLYQPKICGAEEMEAFLRLCRQTEYPLS